MNLEQYWDQIKIRVYTINLFTVRTVTGDIQSRGFSWINSFKIFYTENGYLLFGDKKISLCQPITFSYNDTILVRDELQNLIALKFYEIIPISTTNELFTFYTSC